jgi:hypothetical protein
VAVAAKALPAYIAALADIARHVQRAIGKPPESGAVRMIIAGGTAVHCYTGVRVSRDVDAVFSHRIAIERDYAAAWRDPDGAARALYLDTQYTDTLAPLHEDAHDDALPLPLPGVDARILDVRLLAPTDLAISKLGRYSDVDRDDILALAREGLLDAPGFRARAEEALVAYVGNTDRLRGSIEAACDLIAAHDEPHG